MVACQAESLREILVAEQQQRQIKFLVAVVPHFIFLIYLLPAAKKQVSWGLRG
jgi:hypothetical protein